MATYKETKGTKKAIKNITHLCCYVLGSWLGGKEYMIEPVVFYTPESYLYILHIIYHSLFDDSK